MNNLVGFIKANVDWIFSGIGVFILTALTAFFFKKKIADSIVQKQKAKDKSVLIQIGKIENDKKE